ncbi:MAG: prolipoprotein diacylglyceryl transferase [Syntrophales bacterium]|jgi:phosphatidylglycerol:prolipoprotein diacylglycerol transferase|nr:prolipoprotein diacylglyceryl transferase [Syntrophales bacterium]MDY0045430.1 prolipoprotein diacylglyceryl transferase [Syntrophales bacterium]
MDFWQHLPMHIDPTLVKIGSFQIRYYGLMYLIAFFLTYILVIYRIRKEKISYSKEAVQDFFVWGIVGLIVGARAGYVIFYNWSYFLEHPLEIVLPFQFNNGIIFTGISGMSYHGGIVGVLMASLIFCRIKNLEILPFADLFAPAAPLGYTFGRIGNFLNGELYGRATTVPWGMYFPQDPSGQLRHPSQLYEAFFEGIALFIILWSIRKKVPMDGSLFALYLIGYGTVRFFIEFVRQADPQIGLIGEFLTMGQILCLLMVVSGLILFAHRRISG